MIFDILNELAGKEVNVHPLLNHIKKLLPTAQLIFELSNDQVGKLVSDHLSLK